MTSGISVLFLGRGEAAEELSGAFHRLGVTVEFADAKAAADAGQIQELVGRYHPDYVLPMVEAVAVDALKKLENDNTAVVVPSAHGCELTIARDTLRHAANQELGLPTTAYRFAKTWEEFEEATAEVGFPCIVKLPNWSSGSNHTVISSAAEVAQTWENVGADAGGRVVVEQFIDFDYEVTLLAVRSIDPSTGRLATWFCEPIGHVHHKGRLVESWQPMPMSNYALDNARSMAARISNAIGGRGVCAVEMLVSGDDVYFSGVTPRPQDAGAVTMGTQRLSQYDLHARAILGLPLDATLISPGACFMLEEPVNNLAQALALPEVDIRLQRDEQNLVLATAETAELARSRARQAASL
ncbi:ATP-grasp domain-containing protein [Corynebacterium alimapuense]|uniref:Phosphoribosylglycinamide formyltransferase 2 n=1 Tax=Corynebacterium alimapuense TaxID=1576874 RepID=A0A3M8KAW2_9CORY|nr:ATP-grasp domain-containing protein [Corynebacterium alimapuense]RNE49925.1 phosphoribosylglycinamide formyltransferase 2 [Corynebacterium alimapuense]